MLHNEPTHPCAGSSGFLYRVKGYLLPAGAAGCAGAAAAGEHNHTERHRRQDSRRHTHRDNRHRKDHPSHHNRDSHLAITRIATIIIARAITTTPAITTAMTATAHTEVHITGAITPPLTRAVITPAITPRTTTAPWTPGLSCRERNRHGTGIGIMLIASAMYFQFGSAHRAKGILRKYLDSGAHSCEQNQQCRSDARLLLPRVFKSGQRAVCGILAA